MRWRTGVAAAVVVVVAGGCSGSRSDEGAGRSDGTASTTVPETTTETVPDAGFPAQLPETAPDGGPTRGLGSGLEIVVRVDGHDTILRPFSFCDRTMCADGIPIADDDLQDVGTGGPLVVDFSRSGWSFTAGLAPIGSPPDDEVQVPLRPGPGDTFVLDAPHARGAYRVTVFGQGDGDASYRFRWSV